ncbi:hypothetical protein ACFX1Z_024891 [Malus domestica]
MSDVYRMYRDAYFQDDGVVEPEHERIKPNFTSLLEDAELPLFLGCTKYTNMRAVVVLYKFKAMHGLTDSGYNDLLQILSDMLLDENTLPYSLNLTKKLLKTFDLGYEKINNDCCLFWKDREHLETCPTCDASRWKTNDRTKKIHKGIPAKVLRYFPIIPRLRRMFRSPKKAKQLLWHSKHKSKDGKIRHPIDSSAWERIDRKYPNFASDPRNLRFALSSDGFNPFDDLSSIYSVWPVVLVTYNLPPSLCMSKDNVILSLLIPGKEQPGNDIDVYFEPLIDDLKKLWNNGIEVYDAFSKSMFNLKAILMWTISDFLAYENLSGKKIQEANKNVTNVDKNSVKNDALAKALGPERRGRVKGLGFGATPSQVSVQTYNRERVIMLENELEDLKNIVHSLLVGRMGKNATSSPCVSTNHQGSGNLPNDSANHHANSANHNAASSKPQAKSSNLDAFSGNLNHNSPKP